MHWGFKEVGTLECDATALNPQTPRQHIVKGSPKYFYR